MLYLLNKKDVNFSDARTVVFVDYEVWYWGMVNQHNTTPDIWGWFSDIKEKGRVEEVIFFGDFTSNEMKVEVPKLRNISNNIIDCRKETNKKDYSDFIMLDHIYQKLIRQPDIKQFVLFTGDGHFQSVLAFLRNFNDKTVGVYAVNGSLNPQLAETSNWYVEIDPSNDKSEMIKKQIIGNLKWVAGQQGMYATFKKTVEAICKTNKSVSNEDVSSVLSEMIEKGEILQVPYNLPSNGVPIKKLEVDWKAVS